MKKKYILLVDDDARFSKNIGLELKKYDYHTISVYSYEEAFEKIKNIPGIDLIVIDINLGYRSYKLLETERKIFEEDIPLLFFYNRIDSEILKKTDKIPSYGYVMKDANIALLDASIKLAIKLFEEKQSARKLKAQLEKVQKELLDNETQLKEKENFLQVIYKHSENSVFVVDVLGKGKYRFAGINPVHEKLIRLKNEDLVGKSPRELEFHLGKETVDYVIKYYNRCLDKKETLVSEVCVEIDGRYDWWLTKLTPLFDKKGKIFRLVGNGTIITEQKNTQKKIEKALKEKSLFLKEIHHRVKNNLQLILSFMNLQKYQIKDEESAIKAFYDCERRIYAMSSVHNRLYESKEFDDIDFYAYLESISRSLYSSYIRINIEPIKFRIPIDIALPLGLIASEIISNSVKHAFPNNRKGRIDIYMKKKDDEKQCVLHVRDNGIGYPKNMDWENTKTLGMQIIKELLKQLDGKLKIRVENGTEFLVNFSLK